MRRLTDQQLATHLLAHRGGYSLSYVLRKSILRYCFQGAVLFVLILGLISIEDVIIKGFCVWTAGMILGAILRDFGWLRVIKRQWPFTERVIDWKTVEQLAANREPRREVAPGGAPNP